jgi:hypothetical protein
VTDPAPRRTPLWRSGDEVVLPLFAVLGAVLALLGAYLVPTGPVVDRHVLSLGAAVGVVGNVAAVRLSLRTATAFAPLVLLIGWTAVAIVLSSGRSNGTVVLSGSGPLAVPALVFLVGGLVAGIASGLLRPLR